MGFVCITTDVTGGPTCNALIGTLNKDRIIKYTIIRTVIINGVKYRLQGLKSDNTDTRRRLNFFLDYLNKVGLQSFGITCTCVPTKTYSDYFKILRETFNLFQDNNMTIISIRNKHNWL